MDQEISVEVDTGHGPKGHVEVELKEDSNEHPFAFVAAFSTKIYPQHFDPPTTSTATLNVLEQIKRDPRVQAHFGVRP